MIDSLRPTNPELFNRINVRTFDPSNPAETMPDITSPLQEVQRLQLSSCILRPGPCCCIKHSLLTTPFMTRIQGGILVLRRKGVKVIEAINVAYPIYGICQVSSF
jgi:hypothetical protein